MNLPQPTHKPNSFHFLRLARDPIAVLLVDNSGMPILLSRIWCVGGQSLQPIGHHYLLMTSLFPGSEIVNVRGIWRSI